VPFPPRQGKEGKARHLSSRAISDYLLSARLFSLSLVILIALCCLLRIETARQLFFPPSPSSPPSSTNHQTRVEALTFLLPPNLFCAPRPTHVNTAFLHPQSSTACLFRDSILILSLLGPTDTLAAHHVFRGVWQRWWLRPDQQPTVDRLRRLWRRKHQYHRYVCSSIDFALARDSGTSPFSWSRRAPPLRSSGPPSIGDQRGITDITRWFWLNRSDSIWCHEYYGCSQHRRSLWRHHRQHSVRLGRRVWHCWWVREQTCIWRSSHDNP